MDEKTNILIVDDRPENLLAMSALLEREDLNILTATSGNEALAMTLDFEFALILLDVQMPEMDGFETAELLRQRRRTSYIPIIFVTAINKEKRHIFKGYEKGAVDYLFKPIDPMVLQNKVAVFVELFRQRKSLEKTAGKLERTVARLRDSEQQLKASEEKYRLLVESASDAIMILQDGGIRFHNRRTAELAGIPSDELTGGAFLDHVHPEDRDMVREKHLNRLAAGAYRIPETYTFRAVRNGAETLWCEVTAVLIEWEARPAVLCFVRDITRQRMLEDHLRQAQKMEAIGTLAGGIAHDFNNILGVIIGYSEMASQEIDDIDLVAHNLAQVLKASHRAKELVQQILTFSHKSEQERKPVILNPVIKEALKMLRASLPKTIDIRESVPSDLVITESNPTQIHQVLMNLCTNAAHAMEDGGVLEVTLSPVDVAPDTADVPADLSPGPYVHLMVRDTGHGMDADTLKKIFDPYFTTKAAGKGTGMGLAVVHGIVKSHNGALNVASEPGKGTCFDIFFPRVEAAYAVAETPEAGTLPRGNKRLMFVDDEPPLAEIGKQMLESLGYAVDSRTDPVDAFEIFKKNPDFFDLVITDMTMPGMTGDVLSQRMMAIRPDLPVVICTGYSEKISPARAESIGVKSLLMKPLSLGRIAAVLNDVFQPPVSAEAPEA